MNLSVNEFYHIYNRGNNQQTIFFNHGNYLYFIKKLREQILPVAKIISYCLMPNHFHLIIMATEESVKERPSFGGKPMQELPYRLGILQSSYAQAINKQRGTSGSLFQQKTKAKILSEIIDNRLTSYLNNCFFYVHHNPLAAKLVTNLNEWVYSSYPGYIGLRKDDLCDTGFFLQMSGLTVEEIIRRSGEELPPDMIMKLL
jgi:putative transposase